MLKRTLKKLKSVLIKFIPIRKKIHSLDSEIKNLIFFKKLTNFKIITNSSQRNFMIIAGGKNISEINNTIKKTLKKITW